MIGAPRPTTWYEIKSNESYSFIKPDNSIVLQINGQNLVEEVGYPRRIVMPSLFQVPIDSTFESIMEKMKLLASRSECGLLYGFFNPYNLESNIIGLCYSPEASLRPNFHMQNVGCGLDHKLTLEECWALKLPTDPRYDGPRPTRFEREPVI